MHFPNKLGANILVISGHTDFYRSSTFVAATILDVNVKWIWHVLSWQLCGALTLYQTWFKISYTPRDRRTLNPTFVWWCGASYHQIWCKHLHPIRKYWHFKILDGVRRRNRFSFDTFSMFVVCCLTSARRLIQISLFLIVPENDALLLPTFIWWGHTN